jgi:monoterpene epsilon-lactone hydrolase
VEEVLAGARRRSDYASIASSQDPTPYKKVSMPSPESQQVQMLIRTQIAPHFGPSASLAERREIIESMSAMSAPPPGTTVEKVMIGAIPAEWVSTPASDPDRMILYLHGGGYSIGSCNTHRGLAAQLSAAIGARALVIEYRLAPEYPFPAGLDDATAAYRWLLKGGASPARTVIAGDSAGGGLTLATLLALRDAGDPLPAAAVLFSPWTDLAATGESMVTRAEVDPMLSGASLTDSIRWYIGERDPRTAQISPLYADLRGLPPLFIQVGDNEVLLDDSTRLAERARAAGVEVDLDIWEGMWHVFQMSAAQVPESRQALDKVGALVRARLR